MVADDCQHPFDQVINKSVIPPGRAIPVHWNLLSTFNQAGKLVDRHLRPLPLTIRREDPQTGGIDSIKTVIRIAEEFPGLIACSARGDRLGVEVVFRTGNPLALPINR